VPQPGQACPRNNPGHDETAQGISFIRPAALRSGVFAENLLNEGQRPAVQNADVKSRTEM
jgi:hypothetical protein